MALPFSGITLTEAFDYIKNHSLRTKARMVDARNACAAGTMTDEGMYYIENRLTQAIARWNQAKTFTGMATEFARQYPGYTGNLGQDTNAMINAAIAARDWIIANVPAPSAQPVVLTPAETAPWRTLSSAFENTIA